MTKYENTAGRRRLAACGTGAALICLSTVSTGCAYMMHGSRQRVAVTSTPRGARVLIDDQQVGVTPVQLDLKRHTRTVRLEKEGYHPALISLKRGASGWLISDALVSWNPMAGQGLDSTAQYAQMAVQATLLTFGIDLLTGAAYTLPAKVRATLTPLTPAPVCGPALAVGSGVILPGRASVSFGRVCQLAHHRGGPSRPVSIPPEPRAAGVTVRPHSATPATPAGRR